jgi:O-antigen biosynthesis protein
VDTSFSSEDVANCYRLALGREPESAAVVDEKLTQPRAGLLPDFFSSSEFEQNVRSPVATGAPLGAPLFQERLPDSLKMWAADFAPLTPDGRAAARAASSWPQLFRTLFSDAAFGDAVLNETTRPANPAFLASLEVREQVEALGRVEGRVEVITPAEIRGWAVDTGSPDRRLALQLRVEGAFLAGGVTGGYRPDVQTWVGGDGRAGFVIPRPVGLEGGGRVLLCEAASGTALDAFELPSRRAPPTDAAQAVRRELGELRSLLARIEARLPDFAEAFSYDLNHYPEYWQAYYGAETRIRSPGSEPLDILLVVDASAAPATELDRTLASVAAQSRPPKRVAILHPGGEGRLEVEHCAGRARAALPAGVTITTWSVESGWAAAVAAARSAGPARHLVWLDADARLAPDALERLDPALQAGSEIVYADSDEAELKADGSEGRHTDPRLRGDYDYDLVLQGPDLGPVMAVSGALIDEIGLEPDAGREALFDLLLRTVERRGPTAVGHVARVLGHAAPGWAARDAAVRHRERAAAIRSHLRRVAPSASLHPYADAFGPARPHAFQVRRSTPSGVRAAVIVPTRDRLDLLGPCVASLVASAGANAAAMEIVVVDNQSTAPETRAVLESFSRLAPLRVMEHDGRFNWALINNRAAEAIDADVLIFLNNDTVVLSPNWCDALCAQALRPEVGAVGARLLYSDGSLQHAGLVMGGWHAFAAHEGMGASAGDPGYLDRHLKLRQVCTVTGACLATRTEVFRALGGFDAVNFPVEANDTDYCLRARAKGLAVLYEPACTLHHFESKSRGYNLDHASREAAGIAGRRLRERWGSAYRRDPFYNPHFDRTAAPFTRLWAPPG